MTAATTRTRIAGHPAKCSCTGCFTRLSRYRKQRNLAVQRGTWSHPVPIADVAARLDGLLQAGWTTSQIAAAAQLSAVYVRILARLSSKPQPATVQAKTARAIAALGPEMRFSPAVPDTVFVNSVGSIRRLQSLAAIGWPQTELCQRLGLASAPMLLPTSPILAGRARAIAEVYRQLWNVPGPSNSAAIRARNNGAVPPTAWDDDTIDDPRAQPYGAADPSNPRAGGTGSSDYTVGEVEFLAAAGETTENIAKRLHISAKYVEEVLRTLSKSRCLA